MFAISIGSVHYNNLSALPGPDNPIKDLNYINLVMAFNDMLLSYEKAVVSQNFFLYTYQKQSGYIPQYVHIHFRRKLLIVNSQL